MLSCESLSEKKNSQKSNKCALGFQDQEEGLPDPVEMHRNMSYGYTSHYYFLLLFFSYMYKHVCSVMQTHVSEVAVFTLNRSIKT